MVLFRTTQEMSPANRADALSDAVLHFASRKCAKLDDVSFKNLESGLSCSDEHCRASIFTYSIKPKKCFRRSVV